jgi:hypothetical protein
MFRLTLTDIEFALAVAKMDLDGDGSVSLKEFRTFFKKAKSRRTDILAARENVN